MPLSVRLRRPVYRLGYHVLRVLWLLSRAEREGVKCLLTDGGRVLLVRHTYGPQDWELPGGGVKRGEPPARTAAREMREELGIDGARWTNLGHVQVSNDRRRGLIHVFATEVQAPSLELDLGEIDAAQWFERDQLPPLAPITATVMAVLRARGADSGA